MTLHPLQRLGAEEIRRARALLAGNGLVGEHSRFAYLGLEEPSKAEVLAFRGRGGGRPAGAGDPARHRHRWGGWREGMARRGVTDLHLVRPCPLSAGSFGLQGEEGRRMLRVLSFVQHHPKDHPWAHPVDGLVAHQAPVGHPPTSPPTATSTARTSSCGTPSG